MLIDNNIWQLAEAKLEGKLGREELAALEARIEADPAFAVSFEECFNMLSSLNNSARNRKMRAQFKDIHQQIVSEEKKPARRIISLAGQYWKTAAMAASVALVTSLFTVAVMKNGQSERNPGTLTDLSRRVANVETNQARQQKDIKNLKDSLNQHAAPDAAVFSTGTGFALSNNGYFVTDYHVIEGADSVYIRTSQNEYYKAHTVAYDEKRDLVLMKVDAEKFHFSKNDVPYTVPASKAVIGSRIYTLGFPEDDIVYSEGYISSRFGSNRDTDQYRLNLPSEPGLSGAPVMDERGNLIAVVKAHNTDRQSTTYAVSTTALNQLLQSIPKQKSLHLPKANRLSHMSREQQLEKLQDFTCLVQVYKK